MENKIPIYAGCSNGICYCTGACKEIIGYREPHPLEKEQIDKNAFSKFLNGNSNVCNLDSVNGKGTNESYNKMVEKVKEYVDKVKLNKFEPDEWLTKKTTEFFDDSLLALDLAIRATHNSFTKLSNEVLYELWDNKENSSFYYIAKNGVIKEISSTNYENERQDLDIDITSYKVHHRGMALFREQHIDYFDKFVEKHKNTIFFRTEQEAKNYLKSLTI